MISQELIGLACDRFVTMVAPAVFAETTEYKDEFSLIDGRGTVTITNYHQDFCKCVADYLFYKYVYRTLTHSTQTITEDEVIEIVDRFALVCVSNIAVSLRHYFIFAHFNVHLEKPWRKIYV